MDVVPVEELVVGFRLERLVDCYPWGGPGWQTDSQYQESLDMFGIIIKLRHRIKSVNLITMVSTIENDSRLPRGGISPSQGAFPTL